MQKWHLKINGITGNLIQCSKGRSTFLESMSVITEKHLRTTSQALLLREGRSKSDELLWRFGDVLENLLSGFRRNCSLLWRCFLRNLILQEVCLAFNMLNEGFRIKEQTVLSWNNMSEDAPFLSCECSGPSVDAFKCASGVPGSRMERKYQNFHDTDFRTKDMYFQKMFFHIVSIWKECLTSAEL